jgi:hypothetical protein
MANLEDCRRCDKVASVRLLQQLDGPAHHRRGRGVDFLHQRLNRSAGDQPDFELGLGGVGQEVCTAAAKAVRKALAVLRPSPIASLAYDSLAYEVPWMERRQGTPAEAIAATATAVNSFKSGQ